VTLPATQTIATPSEVQITPSQRLMTNISEASNGIGVTAYILPQSDDWENIPQDPNKPLNAEKVLLGQMLFHETAIATEGVNEERIGSWSCASCHHADAGFKAGIAQGIREGGEGFGFKGTARILAEQFNKNSSNPLFVRDVQPVTSPAILNIAYQDVMLWNGQFGNAVNGIINNGLATKVLSTPGTPNAENSRNFSGLETQAIAGITVHRQKTSEDSIVQTNAQYIAMFDAAYPNGTDDATEDTSKALATFQRTIFANQAPFQEWLKGDAAAMSNDEIEGAALFFGEAGCASCHSGPGLSSSVGAAEDEVFFAVGFADFDQNSSLITGSVDTATSLGLGGFTKRSTDNYKFKIPQLYNLGDTNIFGHGASFRSVRDVVAYKNSGVSQKYCPQARLTRVFSHLV
jgi:cytochrome c peroxidase